MYLFVLLGKQAGTCGCRGWRMEGVFSSFNRAFDAISALKDAAPQEFHHSPDYWTVEEFYVPGAPEHVFALVSGNQDEIECISNEIHGLFPIWWSADKQRACYANDGVWALCRWFSIDKFTIDELTKHEYWNR